MVKNEEKILKRCLESVENIADCFCICDTGSTDNTVNIANKFLETHSGCVTVVPWKNFGHNRSASFDNAQAYIRNELKWNLNDTYGLLLDADMVFVPGTLKKQVLTEPGYSFIQMNGEIEYYNCRLIRMDYPWKCVGVTHEYWDGPTKNISKAICHIDDRNDGGCKHDKFQRDKTLLEKGLKDEPTNGRYMFYLAQTYKCLDLHKEAIKMYKKRINAGGWDEELWYSHYMIGEIYATMKNYPKFEEWMLKAHAYRPSRSEPLAKLAEYFRIIGQHYKSYHYIQLGRNIQFSSDSLFVETKVYQGKFDYEASIVEYYVISDKKAGIRSSVKYLLKNKNLISNVLSNLAFYVQPLDCKIQTLSISPVFGDEYHPSSISVLEYPFANVRFVNYEPPVDGEYRVKNGDCVRTQNSFMNIETGEAISIFTDDIGLEKNDSFTKGIEDVRIYKNKNENIVRYIATNYNEYSKGINIISGIYDYPNSVFTNSKVILSPNNRECEKNWLPVEESGTFIYDWHPLQIGKIVDNEFKIVIRHTSPPIFQLFRGSTPPRVYNNSLWTLVHLTECSKPRKYYHCFVELELKTYIPKRMTLPFVFKTIGVEYCLSFDFKDETTIRCFTSFMDSNPAIVEFKTEALEWVSI